WGTGMGQGWAGQLIRPSTGGDGLITWAIYAASGVRLADRFRDRGDAEQALRQFLCGDTDASPSVSRLRPTASIGEVLGGYLRDEARRHRGANQDENRIDGFRKLALARRPYASLCLEDMYRYIRERRSRGVSDPTILRELQIWKQLVKYARR